VYRKEGQKEQSVGVRHRSPLITLPDLRPVTPVRLSQEMFTRHQNANTAHQSPPVSRHLPSTACTSTGDVPSKCIRRLSCRRNNKILASQSPLKHQATSRKTSAGRPVVVRRNNDVVCPERRLAFHVRSIAVTLLETSLCQLTIVFTRQRVVLVV
jgi:hypothetical protein